MSDNSNQRGSLKTNLYIGHQQASDPVNLKCDMNKDNCPKQGSDDIDIDLEDPGVAKAAVLLQAGFRGLKARQKLNAKKVQKRCMFSISFFS